MHAWRCAELSGTVADKKRLLRVTAGNLRQNHLYVNGHYDFFPADCIGASRKSANGSGTAISILLAGLGHTIETDIGSEARTGRPRRFFRGRTWVRQFLRTPQHQDGRRSGLGTSRSTPVSTVSLRRKDGPPGGLAPIPRHRATRSWSHRNQALRRLQRYGAGVGGSRPQVPGPHPRCANARRRCRPFFFGPSGCN